MKIQNSQNLINFNGLYFKKVSPKVRQAFAECPAIKNISENNDVFISQFQHETQEPYGKILEYGYKCKIVSPPNLFSHNKEVLFDGISETALDLSEYKTAKEVKQAVSNDLTEEISYIDTVKSFIENFTTVIKKTF